MKFFLGNVSIIIMIVLASSCGFCAADPVNDADLDDTEPVNDTDLDDTEPMNNTVPWNNTYYKCDTKVISCKCGKTGGNATFHLKMCPSAMNKENPCEPCSNLYVGGDPCSRLEKCETCQDVSPKCVSCPTGLGWFCKLGKLLLGGPPCSRLEGHNNIPRCASCPRGKFGWLCNKEKIRMRKPITDYIDIKIPRGVSTDKIQRYVRQSDTCVLPERMKTNLMECTLRPSSTTCLQKCVYGHSFPEGKERTIRCEHSQNVWEPSQVIEECDPIINCQIYLKTAGESACSSHKMEDRTWCRIKCLEYDDEPQVPMQTYECHGHELWKPELPFCAIPKETDIVGPPAEVKDA